MELIKKVKRVVYKPLINQQQKNLNKEYELYGLTDDVLEKQIAINIQRHELDLPDKNKIITEDGFVQ